MSKRTSKVYNLRQAIHCAKGGYNHKENPALALPALRPLEPSPWDDEPFRPARADVKAKVMDAYFDGAVSAETAARIVGKFLKDA